MLTTHADSFSMQPSHVADACCMENLMFYSGVMMLDEALWASPSLCAGVISGQCSSEPVAPVICQQQVYIYIYYIIYTLFSLLPICNPHLSQFHPLALSLR